MGSRTTSRARASSWLKAYSVNSASRFAAGANRADKKRSGSLARTISPTRESAVIARTWRGFSPPATLTRPVPRDHSAARLNGKDTPMAFTLPDLPYSHGALAGRGMSQETLELHHDKHHQAYVTALNGFVEKNPELQGKSLEEIIKLSHGKADMAPVFNNAGQHWNHILFWENMSPNGGGIPGNLEQKINSDLGGVQKFKDDFKAAAVGQFGSGWAWLVQGADGKLKITKTPNGSNPLATGEGTALLGVDVWEHSYYIDFRNRRPDYVSNWLDKLANYEYAASKLK